MLTRNQEQREKDEMAQEVQQQWAERAVRAVAGAFPDVEYETRDACERLLLHARVCVQWIEQWKRRGEFVRPI